MYDFLFGLENIRFYRMIQKQTAYWAFAPWCGPVLIPNVTKNKVALPDALILIFILHGLAFASTICWWFRMMGGLIIVFSIRPISGMARYYIMGFLFQYYQFYHSSCRFSRLSPPYSGHFWGGVSMDTNWQSDLYLKIIIDRISVVSFFVFDALLLGLYNMVFEKKIFFLV